MADGMNATLADEVTSINAIYGDDTLAPLANGGHVILRVPRSDISLRMSFPTDYPEARPQVVGPEATGDALPKGEGRRLADCAEAVILETFRAGEPCVYDLIEALSSEVEQQQQQQGGGHDQEEQSSSELVQEDAEAGGGLEAVEEPAWVLSDIVTEKKSVFVARAVRVNDPETAKQNVRHLVTTDKKAAKATHNMTAWRIRPAASSSIVFQDCDDDGESAAGGRLLHLLELMSVWNVMVVVSRWYGGVHLGPDRFRIINSVARDAIVRAGFTEQASNSTKAKHANAPSGRKGGG